MTNAKLLTIKEVAAYLFDNQNRDAYYRARNLIKKHKLQEITVGRRIYVSALPSTPQSVLIVYPTRGRINCLIDDTFISRALTAEQLDQLALRFHQAAIETRKCNDRHQ